MTDDLNARRRELQLLRLKRTAATRATAETVAGIKATERSKPLPLSWAQQRLWFLDQLDHAAGAAYNLPVGLRLKGVLNESALQATLDRILARHESLRTHFVLAGEEPAQIIASPDIGFVLARRDLGGFDADAQAAAVALISAEEGKLAFDLSTGPLVRGRLLRLAADEHVLLLTLHHIVTDGWSKRVLVQEFSKLYSAFCAGQPDPLPVLAVQYVDYAVWQRNWLKGEVLENQIHFWKDHLADAPALLELPTDRPRPAVQSYAGGQIELRLPEPLIASLRALSQRHGVSLFMTMLAGWSVLLARISGQDDVVIGTPIANRHRAQTEHLIGFFVNTLALRVRFDADLTVPQLLAQIKATTLAAYGYQDLPFEQVVEAIRPIRRQDHSPIFQAMLTMNNVPERGELTLPGLLLSDLGYVPDTIHFDLHLTLSEFGQSVIGNLAYASDLFDQATAQRLVQQLETLLTGMVEAADCKVSLLPLLDDSARQRLLVEFNDTAAPLPELQLIGSAFEAQVAAEPDALAVVYENDSLTYAELNRRANLVARQLLAQGVVPDDCVALCVERSVEMFVGILGIVKAGAAYVPMDPHNPADRLAYLLSDCAPVAVLTHSSLTARLPVLTVPVLELDAVALQQGEAENPDPRALGLTGSHLAYVIYTSGSTGAAKGVMVEHHSALNFWAVMNATTHQGCPVPSHIALNASFAFDMSLKGVLQVLSGHCVHIVPQAVRADGALFMAFLARHQIDAFDCTPSQLELLLATGLLEAGHYQPGRVLMGGEAIPAATWDKLRQCQSIAFFNMYGPTECTVDATIGRIEAEHTHTHLGRPIGNAQIYILDRLQQPVPTGVWGEIHIGGEGVARGYLKRPELTDERFMADPFGAAGGRLYRTGDVGRWRDDGRIEYRGRNDFQVKLRGYRIELGEIEAGLAACTGVREAVVVAREDAPGEKRLVAYLVAEDGVQLQMADVRTQLALTLAEYMVPSAFVVLDQLPLTRNGKLDRRALPPPDQSALVTGQYEAPQGPTETAIAAIWQDLLGVEHVGRNDHFFELGGHSLMAVQLMSRLRQAFEVEVDLADLFADATLHAFAHVVEQARSSVMTVITLADRSRPLPLSWAQQRLWFLDQLDHAAGAAYNSPIGLHLKGVLNESVLQASLDRILARHESLRTSFALMDGEPVQVIASQDIGFVLMRQDVSDLGADQRALAVARISTDEAVRAFDLASSPLVRGRLLRLGQDDHVLLLTLHHIVTDGWSTRLLVQELSSLYTAFCEGRDDPLPTLPIQYADYAAWQRNWLQGEVLEQQIGFWKEHLADAPALLELPTDRARPPVQSFIGDRVAVSLSAALTASLRAFGQRHGVSLFMTMLAGWSVLLSRISGQDEVVIGAPIANRHRVETEELIGFFVNTLALRVRFDNELTLEQLLSQVKNTTLAAYAHQDLPFEQVVEALRPTRSMDHSPIFQAMLTLNNVPQRGELVLPGLVMSGIDNDRNTIHFDLHLTLSEFGQSVIGNLAYASDLFDQATAQRLVQQLETLLTGMVEAADCKVSLLPLLDDSARQRLLVEFNDTAAPLPELQLIGSAFEAQVAAEPDALAVVYENDSLTYAELNRRANLVARQLLAQGVVPDDCVALCVERSVEMFVGILGIVKAGAAYVPMDPHNPADRLAYLLSDCAPVAVLTHSSLTARLPVLTVPVLELDAVALQQGEAENPDPRALGLTGSHLAYVIYTSGSTGAAKGVMVEHHSALNFWAVMNATTHQGCPVPSHIALNASFAFDMSLKGVLQVLSGHCVHIVPQAVRADGALFMAFLARHQIDAFDCTPSQLELLLATGLLEAGHYQPGRVLMGGEAIPAATWDKLRQCQSIAFFNMYGPTECTVDATIGRIEAEHTHTHLGRPIGNAQIYILDRLQQPVPTGVWGEIHIGGEGVARGYLKRPELTDERFMADPFGAAGGRLYRTGDVGRWRDDGRIEYRGRNDFQVKLRGYRIELGEIEAGLAACTGVREAVVVAREDAPGEKRLVAYLVAEDGVQLQMADVRTQLALTLAEYMVPSAFVVLDQLPLTRNGKLDRRALPPPDQSALVTGQYEAPQGPTETAIAAIWQDLLGVEHVGRNDHFFELGGHSLMAVQLMSRLRQAFEVEVDLADLFADATLHAFAHVVEQARSSVMTVITLADRSRPLPLSWAQQRLWFLDQLDHAAGAAYNIGFGIRLEGELNKPAFRAALDRLVARHEDLRTTFGGEHGEPCQIIGEPDCGFSLEEQDLQSLSPDLQDEAIRRLDVQISSGVFDLTRGPLIRGHLLCLGERTHVLLVTLHHIITDGWSSAILVNEVATLYEAFRHGEPDPLPSLAIQYADYAQWQRAWLQGAALDQRVGYWKDHLSGAPALLKLPTDRPRPAVQSYAGATYDFEFPPQLSAGLRALSQRHGTTMFMTLLAGWSVLMSRLSGQSDVVTGVPVANRQRSEIEDLIGYFLNTLALRVDLQADPTVQELLVLTKRHTLNAYARQDVPFEQVLDALRPVRSQSHSAVFQTMLGVNNTPPSPQLTLPGLTMAALTLADTNTYFDLFISMRDQGGPLGGRIDYATDLFDRSTITRLLEQFQTLLSSMVADDSQRASVLRLLGEDDAQLMLEEWNRSGEDFPLEQTYASLFSRQVTMHPDRIAAVCGPESVSYRELDARASRVAQALLDAGVASEQLVTLVSERNIALLTMMLAVFKVGAAFLPLDVNHPTQRLREIIALSGSTVLLESANCSAVGEAMAAGLENAPVRIVVEQLWLSGPVPELAPRGTPDDLAYVIFTSGSTGKPKGAMVEQRGMLNHMLGKLLTMQVGMEDCLAQTASPAFDICVWQFLSAALVGASCDILPDTVAFDPRHLVEAVSQHSITLLQIVPSMMRSLLDVCNGATDLRPLRWLVPTGEALPLNIAQQWFALFPTIPVMNVYGPAECSDDVTYHALLQRPDDDSIIPIGRPTPNNHIYLLDQHLQAVPVGVVGEICVGGVGVGRGYLNNPEQTSAAFVPHPFCPGERFYRTGDLGRYRADGVIEFAGRRDFQVKLRGFRIELGEIESKLATCDGVRDAIVMARVDQAGDPRLVAYVVPQDGALPEAAALRTQLLGMLADYMVPSAFVLLDILPLTPNGKIDRAALPAPDLSSVVSRVFEAPRGAVEKTIADVWQQLLGLDQVGRLDNFFELGGHSLLAVQFASRVREQLGVELSLRDLFAQPVLAELALVIARGEASGQAAIQLTDRSLGLPLSWAQERLWFLDRLDHDGGGAAYHLPVALRLRGALNVPALRATLDRIVARHEVLRTTFSLIDEQPQQHIAAADSGFALALHDLRALSESAGLGAVAEHSVDEACAAFDLARGPLVRGRLLQLAEDHHILLVTQHHIVSDGWSFGVLVNEVNALYTAFCAGLPDPLPALPFQYADYAAWQRRKVDGARLQDQVNYWHGKLAGAPAMLDLPTDRARPAQPSFAVGELFMAIPAELTTRLRDLAQRHDCTLFMSLMAGWSALLSRLSLQQDLVIGTPVANRQRVELEGMIGFFVNTLALRVSLHDDATVTDLLRQVRTTTIEAYGHQDVPFERVVEALNPERSMSHHPVFQAMLTMNNTPVGGALSMSGLQLSRIQQEQSRTHFDLTLALSDAITHINCRFEYASELFDHATIERMAGHFLTLLASMADDDARRVSELSLLTASERDQVLHAFNATEVDYPRQQLIDQLFEAQAQRRPDAIALVCGARTISYSELNLRANRLAHLLRTMGVQAQQRVALCTERSIELVIAMLAVLKAGGVYVPLDPSYPAQRLEMMLRDSGAVTVLTQARLPGGLATDAGLPCIVLDSEDAVQFADQPGHDLALGGRQASDLANIIYTSGSTGQPKGVMVEHRGVLRLLFNNGYAVLNEQDCVGHCANPAFDASTWEIWSALLNGAKLAVMTQDVLLDPPALNASLLKAEVTALFLTTGLFNEYLDALAPALGRLRFLLTGGEAIDTRSVAKVLAWPQRPAHLVHMYGPTETTIYAISFLIEHLVAGAHTIPIGKPIANTTAYLLDRHGEPVPLGVVGEICIGGDGVARGYLNHPEQDTDRFVPDPFGADPAARMYRSGDLGRRLADGNIEYQGRNDHQVKIRGFRIELGEIEARLRDCAGVRDALVLVRLSAEGQKRLVAYVVPHEHVALAADALRKELSTNLAAYMVPSAFFSIDAFPLTPNGKLDRKALPQPDIEALASAAYVAPQGAVEVAIAAIWQELLGLPQVGRDDDFFALGGHSLLAVQMMSRVCKTLSVDVPLRTLFATPVLLPFAAAVGSALQATLSVDVPQDHGTLALSWAQQRLWFLDQMDPEGGAVHIVPLALHLKGILNVDALQAALDRIVSRHAALRSRFAATVADPVQLIDAADIGFAMQLQDLSDLEGQQQTFAVQRSAVDEFGRGVALAIGPAFRGRLLHLAADEHVLLLTQHQIVTDTRSGALLLAELAALYGAFSEGLGDPLPLLVGHYADYAAWQRSWLASPEVAAQRQFWKSELDGAPERLTLPTDRPHPALKTYAAASVPVLLDAQLGAALRDLAKARGTTLEVSLLTAWALLMVRLSGQRDVVIGTRIAHRQRVQDKDLIGLFENALAIRLQLQDDASAADALRQVAQRMEAACQQQNLPFEQVVELINPARSMAHSPVFQVMFTYADAIATAMPAMAGLAVERLMPPVCGSHVDLTLALSDEGDCLTGKLEYLSALFEPASVERIAHQYKALLHAIVDQADQPVSILPLQSTTEQQTLLSELSRNRAADLAAGPAQDQLLHVLFEQQAHASPDAPAIEDGIQSMSYAALNLRANQLAHHLLAMGAGPDMRVAICLERSCDELVALLAILKAGAAYVPLDPSYPAARLAYMLRDSEPLAVLTHSALLPLLDAAGSDVPRMALDAMDATLALQAQDNTDADVLGMHARQLAYVIYTSGSTGEPKGVMVEHRQVVNLWRALAGTAFAQCSPASRIALNARLVFDASLQGVVQLLSGHCLVLVPHALRADGAALTDFLFARRIDAFDTTPAQLGLLLDAGLCERATTQPKTILVGGEAITNSTWRSLQQSPGIDAYNVYGPTECTVDASYARLRDAGPVAHIGRPVGNARFYLLDEAMQPVPANVSGEIWIGGAGVSRGYLSREALTAERFVTDPFCGIAGARMYRTGDLGRWLPGKNIEYLGRNDFQVKLRGYRIELGEIEAALRNCAGVRDAVVIVREDHGGDRRLIAYLLTQAGQKVQAAAVREQLLDTLAEYMIPAAFVTLATFPLTSNGKLDRKALPAPDMGDVARREFVPLQGAVEAAIGAIWQDLLGLDRIGRNDNFFELGGHSLLAVHLMGRLRQQLGVEVALRDLFAAPVLSAFAQVAGNARQAATNVIRVANRDKPLPLSWAQQRLWFLDRLDHSAGAAYHMPTALRLTGQLDKDALRASLDRIVYRHEVLRTRFVMHQGSPVQVIGAPDCGFNLVERDMSDLVGSEQELFVNNIRDEEFNQGFDLETGPLVRGQLLRLSPDEHVLYVIQHHVISDGWSLMVLSRELMALYKAFSQRQSDPLPPLAVQYADYAVWQRNWLQGEVLQGQLDFWRRHLGGAPALLSLPTDRPRPPSQSYGGAKLLFELSPEVSVGLRALSQRHGCTLFMTLLTGWSIWLARVSGQQDVVTGTPIANRHRGEVHDLVGFFANTLALRVSVGDDPTVASLLKRVKDELLDAYEHQDVPFEQVVDAIKPPRSLSYGPIFQVIMGFVNAQFEEEFGLPGLSIQTTDHIRNTAQYDLAVSFHDKSDVIYANFVYAIDLFDGAGAECFVASLKQLLTAMVENEDSPVSRLTLLDAQERKRVLLDMNDSACAALQEELLHAIWERHAAAKPEASALVYQQQHLSYGQLNARANQLAHRLLAMGVKPDDRVAICVERGIDLIVAMLATLKAGAAYVPLDPAYPSERLAFMLADSAPVALLTHIEVEETLPVSNLMRVILLDDPDEIKRTANQPGHNPDPQALGLRGDHLAYVIYTSGSTGKPKAVMNQHRGICNFGAAQTALFGVTPESRVLQFASFSFDASLMEITMAYCAGAALHMAEREALMPGEPLIDTLRSHGITHTLLPASALAACGEPGQLAPMTIILGGDVLPGALARLWARRHRVFNAYGPTEAAICAATYACSAEVTDTVPIGRPVANATIYILDGNGQPVPQGVVGELYIGGAGVARGYLNRPELTAERFIDDSFGSVPQARLYRTGDLGRYASDGNIVYLGRNDFQVKIRGFRIELGEIEAGLMACDGVREALVVAREQAGEKRLVAYVVADADEVVPSALALRTQLLASLAEHMVPHAFVVLDAFPLTSNGKLDRNALPEPDMEAVASRAYAEPQGEVETAIAIIWGDILGLERISRHDNFFDLGGHSLLAVQVAGRLADHVNADVTLKNLFEFPVLSDLAAVVTDIQLSLYSKDDMHDLEQELANLSESELLAMLAKDADNA